MDGCECQAVRKLPKLPVEKIKLIFKNESSPYVLTKSILNLLYNIIIVGSVSIGIHKRNIFDQNTELIWKLLSSKNSIHTKNKFLEKNPNFVKTIASICPVNG